MPPKDNKAQGLRMRSWSEYEKSEPAPLFTGKASPCSDCGRTTHASCLTPGEAHAGEPTALTKEAAFQSCWKPPPVLPPPSQLLLCSGCSAARSDALNAPLEAAVAAAVVPAEWRLRLLRELKDAAAAFDFAASGTMEGLPLCVPALHVDGVGRIALPLCSEQAASLERVARAAPFGFGPATIVDAAVRDVLEISASRVRIGEAWAAHLAGLVQTACAGLGVLPATAVCVEAHLYKVLLYREGGHFAAHSDTEKEPGMFGTLLVQLPAGHEGGALVARHGGRTTRVDFAAGSEDSVRWAAFYADVEHSLQPLTSGMRIVLAYNLVRGPAPVAALPELPAVAKLDADPESECCDAEEMPRGSFLHRRPAPLSVR